MAWLWLCGVGTAGRSGESLSCRLHQGRSLNNLMAPPRRSIHQSSEQMAQQKGLNREIAARSLVTLIRAETHEEQTFPKSEIASATREPEPPSLFPSAPSQLTHRLPVLSQGLTDFLQPLSRGDLWLCPLDRGNSNNLERRRGEYLMGCAYSLPNGLTCLGARDPVQVLQ